MATATDNVSTEEEYNKIVEQLEKHYNKMENI